MPPKPATEKDMKERLIEYGITINLFIYTDTRVRVDSICNEGHIKENIRYDSLVTRSNEVKDKKRFTVCSDCDEICRKQFDYSQDMQEVKKKGFIMIKRSRITGSNFKFDLVCHRYHIILNVNKFHMDTFKCSECKIIDLEEATKLPCLHCELTLSLDRFSKDNSNKGRKGYDKYCKSCKKIQFTPSNNLNVTFILSRINEYFINHKIQKIKDTRK